MERADNRVHGVKQELEEARAKREEAIAELNQLKASISADAETRQTLSESTAKLQSEVESLKSERDNLKRLNGEKAKTIEDLSLAVANKGENAKQEVAQVQKVRFASTM